MKCTQLAARVGGALLSMLLVTFAPELGNAQSATTDGIDGRGSAPDSYRIGPEDNLRITVWKNEQMSGTVPVRPDGKISLPLVNDVQAAGLTPLELREILTGKLKDFMPNPEVSVTVVDVRSLKVSVMGEVSRPGRYDLKSWATVLDALALAGGFTQFASRSKIMILQSDGKTMKRIPFNYNDLAGKQENFFLRNGDIVLVP